MATSPVTIDPSDVQAHVDPTDVQVDSGTPPAAPPTGSVGEQNFVNPMAQAGADMLTGVGQGVAGTVHGTGELIRKGLNFVHAGAGDTVVPPSGQKALDQAATPVNTAQKVGKTAEDIGEFVTGDEALKGLSLGKRALEAAGLAEKYEKASPFVKAAIEHTMNAVRSGTTAGAVTTAKTGDVGEGAKAGAGAAVGSVALGAASDLVGAGVKYVRAAKAFKDLPGALDKGLSDIVSQKAVADGLKATTGTTAAEHLADSALQYQTRAKAAYQMVDNAVDGELQPIQDKLTAVKKAIKVNTDLNPDLASKLIDQKQQLEKSLQGAIERAKANGVPDAEKIIKQADSDYNKFRAQSDLSTRLQKAAGPEGAASPAGLHQWSKQLGTPKVVGGTSRMAQALGDDGAKAVLQMAAEGRGKAAELAAQADTGSVIKKAAFTGAAGAAGAGAVGYPLYRALGGMHGH